MMQAALFRKEVLGSLEAARGTYIYDAARRDLDEKTAADDPCGYRRWLAGLAGHVKRTLGVDTLRVLDVGCGNGELTVLLNLLGIDALGLDVDERSLRLARILACENGIPPSRFMKGEPGRLAFGDDAFNLVTLISSLEHIDPPTLVWLVPELARVCEGIVFVQVPSPMKVSDDHTGLRFVPWMPAALARRYVALRGARYRYLISGSARWDVVYRDLAEIERAFAPHFAMSFVPVEHSYPPCAPADAVLDLRKRVSLGGGGFPLRVPIPWRRLQLACGRRSEHFYPYYNLAFRRR